MFAVTKFAIAYSILGFLVAGQPAPPTITSYSLEADYSYNGGPYAAIRSYYDAENNRSRWDDLNAFFSRIDDGKKVISVQFNESYCDTECAYGKNCQKSGPCEVSQIINLFQYLSNAKYNGTCGLGVAFSVNILNTTIVYCFTKDMLPVSFVMYLSGITIDGIFGNFSPDRPSDDYFQIPPKCPCFGNDIQATNNYSVRQKTDFEKLV